MRMRSGFTVKCSVLSGAALGLLAACAEVEDLAAPSVNRVLFHGESGDIDLADADPADPFAADPNPVPLTGELVVVYSELLDGNSVQEVVLDPELGTVEELHGRDGVVSLVWEGQVLPTSIVYDPAARAVRASWGGFLPADSVLVFDALGGVVADKAGNVLTSEPVSFDWQPGVSIGARYAVATFALVTEPIAILDFVAPEWGQEDDFGTLDVDESVPYDAAGLLVFNTDIDPLSLAGLVRFIRADGAIEIDGIPLEADEDSELDPGTVEIEPAVPLDPGTDYELRIDPGFTDSFAIPYTGNPAIFPVSTL